MGSNCTRTTDVTLNRYRTTETRVAYDNSTWHTITPGVHKLHQGDILKKGCSLMAYIPSIARTLGDTGVSHRTTTEPFLFNLLKIGQNGWTKGRTDAHYHELWG